MSTRKSLIVAMSKNRVIGVNNTLPWHLSADLKHFKALTMGHPIIMGRKTHESIGKALPGRRNIVVTNNKHYQATGCDVVTSLADAIKTCNHDDEIFFIGGATLYHQALPLIERIYLTEVDCVIDGDTHFPTLDPAHWRESASESHSADEKNAYAYRFATLERNP
jgi:dihydrofolate reductase